jgi:hypothetical protein
MRDSMGADAMTITVCTALVAFALGYLAGRTSRP